MLGNLCGWLLEEMIVSTTIADAAGLPLATGPGFCKRLEATDAGLLTAVVAALTEIGPYAILADDRPQRRIIG